MFWKIALVLGILGILLGVAASPISAALPFVTAGRTSWTRLRSGSSRVACVHCLDRKVYSGADFNNKGQATAR